MVETDSEEQGKVLEEQLRREEYLRAYKRPVRWQDPFTWSYPLKTAGFTFAISVGSFWFFNLWRKKPLYFGIVPSSILIAAGTALGYGAGKLREHHYRTRDAVIQHYISLHPEDFDHLKDYNGRPFSQILLPWYPVRTEYTKFEK